MCSSPDVPFDEHQAMLLMLKGLISLIRNVKMQLEAVASAAARVRMTSGAYSVGTNLEGFC